MRHPVFPPAFLAQTCTLMCLLCPSSCSSPCLDIVPVARQFSCCNKDSLLCRNSLHSCDNAHYTWCLCRIQIAAVCCLLAYQRDDLTVKAVPDRCRQGDQPHIPCCTCTSPHVASFIGRIETCTCTREYRDICWCLSTESPE